MVQEVGPSENGVLQIVFFLSSMGMFLKHSAVLCMPFILTELQKCSVLRVLGKENAVLLSALCCASLMYLLANGNTKPWKGHPFQLFPTQLTIREREEQ